MPIWQATLQIGGWIVSQSQIVMAVVTRDRTTPDDILPLEVSHPVSLNEGAILPREAVTLGTSVDISVDLGGTFSIKVLARRYPRCCRSHRHPSSLAIRARVRPIDPASQGSNNRAASITGPEKQVTPRTVDGERGQAGEVTCPAMGVASTSFSVGVKVLCGSRSQSHCNNQRSSSVRGYSTARR